MLSWLLAQAADLASDTFAAPDWVMKMLVTLLALLFPLVLFFEMGSEPFSLDSAQDSIAATKEKGSDPIYPISDPKSIAVLPFVNMSSDPEQEYFSDGISEEILNALSRVSELKVAGRTSSFAFKGENQDLQVIGKALRVAHLLEGSVRKSGNKLRITAQLIKVDDGFHLWSETYDREMDDIFAIQDEISNAILVQLKARLLGGESVAIEQVDPQAYAQYLLAKQRIYERNQASLELAADLLKKAIETDPGFAAAQAQLGIATLLLSEEDYGTLPIEQSSSEGLQHLKAALALEPEQAEALAGMGLYHANLPGGCPEAIAWLRRSLEADPHQSNASNWLANYLGQSGQHEESLALREKDFARDPLYMPVFSNLVQRYTVRGDVDKARKVLDQLRPYLHDDANMLMTEGGYYQVAGNWAEADKAFSAAYAKEPRNFVNQIWYCNNLNFTAQYQQCAELSTDTQAAISLTHLGRSEEGLIRGHKSAAKGQYPGFYFQALVENGQNEQLVQFVEERWPDLASLDRDFPELQGWGTFTLAFVAEAYRNLGNKEKFREALELTRASNEQQLSQGADNWSISLSSAQVAALEGHQEQAITLLERAFNQGLVVDLIAPKAWPVFQPLRGDPRFEAARSKMLEHLNAERAELGLEPLQT
ncbi:MAG: hypothetical protein SH820_13035 [Xanthomonadales bacterium]|nr:hypothetical protein [Xanthomonadales bacterium]